MNNVLELVIIDQHFKESIWPIVFDHDIRAYKGTTSIANFKFPLFTNLVKLQKSNLKLSEIELMFSCNESDTVHVFVYNAKQKMYSNRYKSLRLSEKGILEILYNNSCDEATIYFDGHKFDFIYQTDNNSSSCYSTLWNFATSVPFKLVYVLVLLFKGYALIMWLRSIHLENFNIDIPID